MKKHWVVSALVAGGVVLAVQTSGGCLNSKAPDEKIAARFDDMCEIARDNVKTPVDGVRKLGRYFVKHTEDLLHDWGATLMTIEKISDDDDHDERARTARDRIITPLVECADGWEEFLTAVEQDKEASLLVSRAFERLDRTLQIIFEGASLDLRTLPAQLIEKTRLLVPAAR